MIPRTLAALFALVLVLCTADPGLAQSIGGQGPPITPSQVYPSGSSGLAWLTVPILWAACALLALATIRRASESH